MRSRVRVFFHGTDPNAKLMKPQEALSGVIGGSLSCWNHPFEV